MRDIEFFPDSEDPKKRLEILETNIDNMSTLLDMHLGGWNRKHRKKIAKSVEYMRKEAESAVLDAVRTGVYEDADIRKTFYHVVDTFGLYRAAAIIPSDETSRHSTRNQLIMQCLSDIDRQLSSDPKDYEMVECNNALIRDYLDKASRNGIAGEIYVNALMHKYRKLLPV